MNADPRIEPQDKQTAIVRALTSREGEWLFESENNYIVDKRAVAAIALDALDRGEGDALDAIREWSEAKLTLNDVNGEGGSARPWLRVCRLVNAENRLHLLASHPSRSNQEAG